MRTAHDALRETMDRRDAQALREALDCKHAPGYYEAARNAGPLVEEHVVLPNHYGRWDIEPIRFIVQNNGPGFLLENATKYLWRYDAKNGHEDLAKASRYLEMLRAYESGDPAWWEPKGLAEIGLLPTQKDAPLRSKPNGR